MTLEALLSAVNMTSSPAQNVSAVTDENNPTDKLQTWMLNTILSLPWYGFPVISVPETVTDTSVETVEDTVQLYVQIAEEAVALIGTSEACSPEILMVGEASIASEKAAVIVITSPFDTEVVEES